jgi:GR25 family glycosyltransferase involved in LPS biosynthesis
MTLPGFVISLARRPDRRERFLRWNSGKGIELTVVDAVDGQQLSRPQMLRANLIDEEAISFSNGHLGAALSHRALWERCIALDQPILIFEDDVFLPDNLADWTDQFAAELANGCDILYAGYNRDALLSVGFGDGDWCNIVFQAAPGSFEYRARQHGWWSARNSNSHCVLDTRLVWGITAYAIAPAGAQALMKHCFPLSTKLPVRMFGAGRLLTPGSVDAMVNLAVQRGLIKARVMFPPLVVGPNDPADSDNNPRPR